MGNQETFPQTEVACGVIFFNEHLSRVQMPGRGLEPLRISPPDPKSDASANFATLAIRFPIVNFRLAIANDAGTAKNSRWQTASLCSSTIPNQSPRGPNPSESCGLYQGNSRRELMIPPTMKCQMAPAWLKWEPWRGSRLRRSRCGSFLFCSSFSCSCQFRIDFSRIGWRDATIIVVRLHQITLAHQQRIEAFATA